MKVPVAEAETPKDRFV